MLIQLCVQLCACVHMHEASLVNMRAWVYICYMGMHEVYVILGSMCACVFASISADVCMGSTCMHVHR